MPQKVARWRATWEVADPELRSLIERHISSVARRRFGDVEKSILLSLPPKSLSRGKFNLGDVVYCNVKWPFGLSAEELMQNVAIFGRSGAGKTNVAFHLLEQLTERRVPWLMLDWKRTGRHLIPRISRRIDVFTPGRSLSPFHFNPFIAPPGLEERVYLHQVVDVLGDAFTLGDGSRSILHRVLNTCYEQGRHAPTVADLLEELDKIPAKQREHGWKISARRALESLNLSGIVSKDAAAQEEFAASLLSRNTVVELDGLSDGAKKFLVPILCLWLYSARLGASDRERLRFVILIEEAHHVLYRQERRSKESLMNSLIRQFRELGVGTVIVDQHPHLISSAAVGNTYTSICLNLKDPTDINKAAGLSLLDEDEKRCLTTLPVGQAIVKLQDRWRRPFLVQIPHVAFSKGAMTDPRLRALLRRYKAHSDRRPALGPEFRRVRQGRLDDRSLSEEEVSLIEDAQQHPDDGVRARYERLGLSAEKGTRSKEDLLDLGWLESEMVPLGRTRRLMLRLTKPAREALGIPSRGVFRESIAHAYWKRWYARWYRERGYAVQVEAPRVGGRVDVLAEKDGERIGIEIETGKSDVVANVRNCLAEGFDRVIVVVTRGDRTLRISDEIRELSSPSVAKVRVIPAGTHWTPGPYPCAARDSHGC
ncbi:MAG: DUF87 domain-containing protein [Phycisphaerales bacterium]|nr:DUF87 domain-containing protein [Phycisphaerales bacterium]